MIITPQTELVGKAFHAVKEEFRLIFSPALQFTEDQFNTLVALYAKKALEFTVVQSLEMAGKIYSAIDILVKKYIFFYIAICCVFSSPELKAHGELI